MEAALDTPPARGPIPFCRPALGEAELAALREAFASGWVGTGIFTRLFERRFAQFAGARYAAGTNSGTAALQLALTLAGAEGGEVVSSPLTNVATSHAILQARAVPVFCDVDPATGTIDPKRIAELLTPRTRAIVAVHLHGHPCDMDPILALARGRGIPVVEDACQAVEGFYRGRPLGTLGAAGCFSFGRFKSLTTVDGGALVHGREDWVARLGRLRRLGHAPDAAGFTAAPEGIAELGWHNRLNDVAAALGLAQLERWETLKARLDALAARYRAGLAGLPGLSLPKDRSHARSGYSHFALRCRDGRKDELLARLRAGGVGSEDWLYPNHLYALYRPYARPLPVAERLWKEFLYLPFYPELTDGEADRVIELLRRR